MLTRNEDPVGNLQDRLRQAYDRLIDWYRRLKEAASEVAEEAGEREEALRQARQLIDIPMDPTQEGMVEALTNLSTYAEATADLHGKTDPSDLKVPWLVPLHSTTSGSTMTGTIAVYDMAPIDPRSYPALASIQETEAPLRAVLQKDRRLVERWLREIDESIADEYRQAWQSWSSGTHDPARSAAFLMREAVRHCVDKLLASAPEASREGKRRDQAKWIAENLILDPQARKRVLKYAEIYGSLSYAHIPGTPKRSRVRSALLSGHGFLLTLAGHVDLNIWRRLQGTRRS